MADFSLSNRKGGEGTKRMSNVLEQGFPKCGLGNCRSPRDVC